MTKPENWLPIRAKKSPMSLSRGKLKLGNIYSMREVDLFIDFSGRVMHDDGKLETRSWKKKLSKIHNSHMTTQSLSSPQSVFGEIM